MCARQILFNNRGGTLEEMTITDDSHCPVKHHENNGLTTTAQAIQLYQQQSGAKKPASSRQNVLRNIIEANRTTE
jgi:hypothetical protein